MNRKEIEFQRFKHSAGWGLFAALFIGMLTASFAADNFQFWCMCEMAVFVFITMLTWAID